MNRSRIAILKKKEKAQTEKEAMKLTADDEIDAAAEEAATTLGGFPAPSLLTIAGGAITVSTTSMFMHHKVDTEALAAADDLSLINGGRPGAILALLNYDAARQVTVKNNAVIDLGGADKLLYQNYRVVLMCQSTGVWNRFSIW